MRILKRTLAITSIVFVSMFFIATASARRVEVKQQQAEVPNFENFPIVDFEAKEAVEPKVKAARDARARVVLS